MSQTDALPVTRPEAAGDHAAHAHGACENCHTELHGHYCHVCGQSAHNPLKHVGHAIEEVFESFWHLDGRIFRTLRRLLIPGRVALDYLKGHRVGYVQPLRLFVILTLFTFFVGKLTLHVDDINLSGGSNSIFAKATTAQEVETIRAAQIAELERQQRDSPGAASALAMVTTAMNAAAAQRSAQLADQTTSAADPATDAIAVAPAQSKRATFFDYPVNGKPWNAENNPVVIPGAPQFVDHWLNRRLQNGNKNVERMGRHLDLYVQAILTALPGALFFLMPVFALVLRIAYVPRPTGYLEHLVVALYSHCWLMLVLLGTFLLIGINHALAWPVLHSISTMLYALLWLAVPVYLLWMQQRVYGGRLLLTLLRYSFIGGVYLFLVNVVVVYAVLMGVSA